MKYGEKQKYMVNDQVEVVREGPGVVVGKGKRGSYSVKMVNGELILGVTPSRMRPFGGDK